MHADRARRAKADSTVPYEECLQGGDIQRGSELFFTHIAAQCVRCHRVGRQGSNVGPPLDDIGTKRDARHLLRAMVAPSADVDKKYRTTVALLDSGQTVQGVLIERTEKSLRMLNAQGKEVEINTDEIEETIEQGQSIMPEMTQVLSRREIRDLVAYLQSLQQKR